MERPHIVCHMVVSLDGKVTGSFLFEPPCAQATEAYYRLHRQWQADGFICGRVTMEESFTGGWYPDVSQYEPMEKREDHVVCGGGFYAVAFDPRGRLGWRSPYIEDPDEDPGYHGARIVEVLSRQVDGRYLSYLEDKGISYLFAGEDSVDVKTALIKLKKLLGCRTLLLEGGSLINGAFQRAGAVDELSLVVAPTVADGQSKPLFADSALQQFTLLSIQNENGIPVLRYKRT